MIDQDLSHQLHSLAATVDEPFDLVALHRRITVQSLGMINSCGTNSWSRDP